MACQSLFRCVRCPWLYADLIHLMLVSDLVKKSERELRPPWRLENISGRTGIGKSCVEEPRKTLYCDVDICSIISIQAI